MTLSRTARYLILFLLLAAAAFVWINFFFQDRTADGGDAVRGDTQPEVVVASVQPDASAPEVEGAAPTVGEGATTTGAVPAVEGTEATNPVPTVEGAEGMAVVAPSGQTAIERELVVAEFPFLVTQPPAASAAAGGDEGGVVERPQTRRASINPFSPVLVQVPAAPATPVATVQPPAAAPVVEVVAVAVPGAPARPTIAREPVVETVIAPTPRPLAPPSPSAQGLPRQLPRGTLPVAPDILQSARVAPQPVEVVPETPPQPEVEAVRRPEPGDVTAAAAIREPSDTLLADLSVVGADTAERSSGLPGLLGPAAIMAEAPSDAAAVSIPVAEAPLAAGTDRLSAFLRDNGFAFTGSVLGPVSVGVFRSPLYTAPVVVALGQTLPDTDIVLTDLRGQQAAFTLDEATQVLTLDLRR